MELRRWTLRGPVEPVHAAPRPNELLRNALLVRGAHLNDVGIAHEDELPTPTEQARRLWYPLERVAPDRGPVLGEGKVEAGVWQRHVLGIRLDELQPQPELLVHRARGLELRGGDVDAHDARCSVLLEPGAEV